MNRHTSMGKTGCELPRGTQHRQQEVSKIKPVFTAGARILYEGLRGNKWERWDMPCRMIQQ